METENKVILAIFVLAIIGAIWLSVHEAAECAAVGGKYHPSTQYQHSQCEMSYKK